MQTLSRWVHPAVQNGQALACEDQGRRTRSVQYCRLPRFGRLIGVSRSDDGKVGHSAQIHDLLDGLVCRAVFSQSDAVVGEDKDGLFFLQRHQPHWRPHIVGESQKGCCIGDQPAVEGHAVGNGAHRVLANAKVQVATAEAPFSSHSALRACGGRLRGLEIPQAFEPRVRGGFRSAEPPISSGSLVARACRTDSEALRVAGPLTSAENDGTSASQSAGSSPAIAPLELSGQRGMCSGVSAQKQRPTRSAMPCHASRLAESEPAPPEG